MVTKLTLLELHLDDARFTNAMPGRSDAVDESTDAPDASEDLADESTGGHGLGRRIGMLAFALGLAVGVRMAVRRFRSDEADEDEAAEILEDASVSVDVDERVDA